MYVYCVCQWQLSIDERALYVDLCWCEIELEDINDNNAPLLFNRLNKQPGTVCELLAKDFDTKKVFQVNISNDEESVFLAQSETYGKISD